MKNNIFDLKNQIDNMNAKYEKLTNEMSKLEIIWHREINFVFIKMKREINAIKSSHLQILRTHFDDIKQAQSLIQQTSERLKKIVDSNEINRTI